MTWLCHCGLVNNGLNEACAASKSNVLGDSHYQISPNTPDFESIVSLQVKGVILSMTEQEELFSKFYNHEKLLVASMDVATLREHREELSKIAFEAKARLVAADDETRERKAKAGAGKEWLVSTNSDVVTSDAINAVKVRAARMSKMDKLKQQLLSAGIAEETVKEMVANMERKATDKNLKTVTFNKPSTELTAVTVKTTNTEPVKPFDPTSLFSK